MFNAIFRRDNSFLGLGKGKIDKNTVVTYLIDINRYHSIVNSFYNIRSLYFSFLIVFNRAMYHWLIRIKILNPKSDLLIKIDENR